MAHHLVKRFPKHIRYKSKGLAGYGSKQYASTKILKQWSSVSRSICSKTPYCNLWYTLYSTE